MNKKVVKPLFLLSFAFCLAFLSPLSTFAEEDILNGTDEEILKDSNEEILNNCENAIDVWSDSKLRRYAEDNILYYDDQFECEKGKSKPENPCIDGDIVVISGSNTWSIMNSLRAAGYNDTSIAGIMGNLAKENGTHIDKGEDFEPRKFEIRDEEDNSLAGDDYRLFTNGVRDSRAAGANGKGRGFGIAQWTTAGRQEGLQNLADQSDGRVTSLKNQIAFLIQELTGKDFNLPPSVLNGLSLREVSDRILLDYEKPKDKSDSVKEARAKESEKFYTLLKSENPGDSGEAPIPSDENCTPVDDMNPVEIDEYGLTYEDALKFAMRYGENVNNSTKIALTTPDGNSHLWDLFNSTCHGGSGSNCVSFSAFFVNKFTPFKNYRGNGSAFASNIPTVGSSLGTNPQVFSVFQSKGGAKGQGHTGVVLGYHDGKYIVGHASCSRDAGGPGDGTKDGTISGKKGSAFIFVETSDKPEEWQYPGGNYYDYQFAYLKDYVNISAIEEYIRNGE